MLISVLFFELPLAASGFCDFLLDVLLLLALSLTHFLNITSVFLLLSLGYHHFLIHKTALQVDFLLKFRMGFVYLILVKLLLFEQLETLLFLQQFSLLVLAHLQLFFAFNAANCVLNPVCSSQFCLFKSSLLMLLPLKWHFESFLWL